MLQANQSLSDLNQEEFKLSQPDKDENLSTYRERINKISRNKISIQEVIPQKLDDLPFYEIVRSQMKESSYIYVLLAEIVSCCQDMTNIYCSEDIYAIKINQLMKLATIAQMQTNQILNSFNDTNNIVTINYILGKFEVPIENSNQINDQALNIFYNFIISKQLIPIRNLCEEFFQQNKQKKPKELLRQLSVYSSKLQTTLEQYPYAMMMPKDDLFFNSKSYKEVLENSNFKVLDTEENLKASFDNIRKAVTSASAAAQKKSECSNPLTKSLIHNLGPLYYMINSKKGESYAQNFHSDPSTEQAIAMWNMGENGIMKKLLPIFFDKIQFNQKIYIPRQFKQITLDYILNQYKDGKINQINNGMDDLITQKVEYIPHKILETEDKNKICVRVLCHEKLKKQIQWGMVNQQSYPKIHSAVIIHIHGGGFVAMSSRTHQTYTRRWANNLKVPIFSIDYRKAPQNPYPAGLDDVWQAYLWIIHFSPTYFNIIPKRIILTGDSAGGNLVAALTILAIKQKVRIPDGILMSYPALNLNLKTFTPSYFIALDDILLPHTFLKMCLNSYVQDSNLQPNNDPLLSPVYASDQILQNFPKTRIFLGTKDPLHDDCLRFAHKLILFRKLKIDVKLQIYPGLTHGFLQFDTPQGLKESKIAIQDVQDELQRFLNQ